MKYDEMPDQDLEKTRARLARRERILDRLRLPLTLLGGGACVGLAVVAGGALGLTLQGIAMWSVLAGVVGSGTAFGFADKYACKWGERALALSMSQGIRHINRVEHEFKQTLPLKGEAAKAFIKALTEGICEKLHIRKPLSLVRKPPQANL